MAATIYDVAKLANVSISTVSRVLNNNQNVSEETRQKVLAAVSELKFRKNILASALMKKPTSTFGLIIPDIKNIFYADLTRSIEDYANKFSFNVILCNTDNDLAKELTYLEFLLQKGVDGIIISTPEVDDENIRFLQEANSELPIIILGSKVEGASADEVLVDNEEGGYLATRHLLELGHRNIAFLPGNRKTEATIGRRKGFERAHKDFELNIDEELILQGEFKHQSGYLNTHRLFQGANKPTAIFAGNDLIAVGVYRAARELGLKIPDDLSVIGFDDTEYAEILTPQLTTIRTPIKEVGERAVKLAIKTIRGEKKVKETVVFRPTLILRESTKNI